MKTLIENLHDFLRFLTESLASQPERSQIRITEPTQGAFHFDVIVTSADLKELLGRHGATAAAIRRLITSLAADRGFQASIHFLSFEEDVTRGFNQPD